jgi:hypothetical protein
MDYSRTKIASKYEQECAKHATAMDDIGIISHFKLCSSNHPEPPSEKKNFKQYPKSK